MLLGLTWNVFVYRAKKAQAILGIGDIVIDVLNEVKDWIVDEIPRRVARHMMVRLQQEITRWAQGGFTDENKPFAMTSWTQEIREALGVASAKFIEEFNLTALCLPIRITLGERLGLTQTYTVPYTQYAACTMETVVDNVADFWENPSIGLWGWDTWTALSQPQNNIYGSVLLASDRKAELESEQIAEKELQKDTGQGYGNDEECVEYQQMTEAEMAKCKNEDCANRCDKYVESNYYTQCLEQCWTECEQRQTGICLEYKTKNIGSTIHSAIEKALGSDIDWLISAHEITEMIGIIFSGLFNKLFHGTGMASQPFYRAESTTEYQAEYGYYKEYKKAQTPEDIKKLRTDILDNILKAVQRISNSSYECEKDYQLKGEVIQEVAAEILAEESQHLYIGYEGVDLKADFEVLDGPAAVNNGIAVYGQTWDDISFSKYPSKCSEILGMRCEDVSTGLPEELSSDCSRCVSKLNDIRVNTCDKTLDQCLKDCPSDDETCKSSCQQEREACNENAYYQAVNEGACSSYNAAYSCLSQGWLIAGTDNRCDQCLKDGALCEGKADAASRESCINEACNNYGNISQPKSALLNPDGSRASISGVISGSDFYNKCSIKVKKDSCYTCLKEYFMPAQYCEVIYDFINRSFVKYPAQVYEDLWWGTFNDFADCANCRSANETIPVGLTCRILPDFIFPSGGTCSSLCNVTEDELKDITDDQPNDLDCGNGTTWRSGGFHPGGQYVSYLVRTRAKCCAALTGHDPDLYRKCRGITGDQPEETPIEEQTSACLDGEEGRPDEGEIREAFGTTNLSHTLTGSPIIGPMINDGAYNNCVVLRSQNPHATAVTVYITEPYCDAYRDLRPEKVYWSNIGGGGFTNSLVDIGGTHDGQRETVSYCCASPNTNSDGSNLVSCPDGFVSPPSDKILCTFDIDGTVGSANGPTGIDSITGEPYKVCCGLSSYKVNYPSKTDCINAGVPSDLCNKSQRFFSNGLYIVAVPDQADSLGGVDLCACENPSAGCGSTCQDAGCSP